MYQLPVSYFTAADKWANSPQYPTHPVLFNRPITSRCLECHTTFAQRISAPDHKPEDFDPNIIYGVDCEKCHGPAARHVEFQTQNPKDNAGKIYSESRQNFQDNRIWIYVVYAMEVRLQIQNLLLNLLPATNYLIIFRKIHQPSDPENIDVHGNQLGLLSASKCFRMSQTMTCTTCHNPHENERGKIALFSQRCIRLVTARAHNNIAK